MFATFPADDQEPMPKKPPFRVIAEAKTSIGYRNPGNKDAVVFVHGLGGNGNEYWGRLVDLLNYDPDLVHIDFFYWQFKSSKFFVLPPVFHLASAERVSSIPELSLALAGELQGWIKQFGYERVSILGHSLGGLITCVALPSLAAAPIQQIALIATPQKANWFARQATRITRRTNLHLEFLADERRIKATLSKGLADAKAHAIKSTYFHCVGDALQTLYRSYPFDAFIDIQGPHSWMKQVGSRQDSSYTALKFYLLS